MVRAAPPGQGRMRAEKDMASEADVGRGYVFGLLAGALFSSAGVGALSLMLPPVALTLPPDAPDAAVTPAPEAPAPAPAAAPVAAETAPPAAPAAPAAETTEVPAAPAPEPQAAPPLAEAAPVTPAAPATTLPAPQPDAAVATGPAAVEPPEAAPAATAPADDAAATVPAPTEVATAAPLPVAPVVDVPAGSEFNRPKPEEDPVVPAPQPAPAARPAPTVAEPAAEAGPTLTERTPAAAPEGQTAAPVALPEPAPAAPEPIAEAPAGETAVPVPPPGEAMAPDLAPAPEDEIAMAEDDAPGPIADDAPGPIEDDAPGPIEVPDAGAGLPAAGRLPQIIAPEPSQPETETGAPADPAAEAVADAAIRPRFLTPGTGRAGADGPVIIDIAPQAPIGAAAGPRIGFQKVPGVQVNRLPSVAAPDAPDVAAVQPQGDRALDRYAATFANPEGKPLIAVILIDDGALGGVDPDSVAAIGAPVTIAINPESQGAAVRAQTYRLSGDEIAILAPALPAGATPSDVEIAYQGIVQMLPESVALMAAADSALQGDRRLAQHMAALLGAEGRALVTYAKGLNPARQAADRAGVPYAGITRSLEEAGQDDAAMQRLLDRAAFEAARSGTVVIVGQATPVTVSALTGWVAAGRKAAVIGPLSAAVGR